MFKIRIKTKQKTVSRKKMLQLIKISFFEKCTR